MYVCAETIYQEIYRPGSDLRRLFATAVAHRPSAPAVVIDGEQRNNRFVEPMTMIDDRPVEVDDRQKRVIGKAT